MMNDELKSGQLSVVSRQLFVPTRLSSYAESVKPVKLDQRTTGN
jgi:hypothetical protein